MPLYTTTVPKVYAQNKLLESDEPCLFVFVQLFYLSQLATQLTYEKIGMLNSLKMRGQMISEFYSI